MRGGGAIHSFDSITSIENLLLAWQEFIKDKKQKEDVQKFQLQLMDNIFNLHQDLKNKTYKHGEYKAFKINDPKPRDIHKASVRDRLLHHAIYRILYPYFDRKFIYDSYSCRIGKGTHKAINRFRDFSRKVSKNNTKTCWILKCDIRKFFANINHEILKSIISVHMHDSDTHILLSNIIDSFYTKNATNSARAEFVASSKRGLPLGNLTSQLLVNVYMNEFDQYMKHVLKVKYYIRYADDFVILSENKSYLENLIPKISQFLNNNLKLQLHPDKLYIKTLASGVDFLGWVQFPYHRVLRTATKKRMFRNLKKNNYKEESIQSYLGMLRHGDAKKLEKEINSTFK
ncbi:MAG TPA: reverse transcriptase/maturase family protein [Candidatus Paceibacterota bacterium]|nr:reverse transcriptase/maturase family protein [Candidatus Paceibacterota bacterium]